MRGNIETTITINAEISKKNVNKRIRQALLIAKNTYIDISKEAKYKGEAMMYEDMASDMVKIMEGIKK